MKSQKPQNSLKIYKVGVVPNRIRVLISLCFTSWVASALSISSMGCGSTPDVFKHAPMQVQWQAPQHGVYKGACPLDGGVIAVRDFSAEWWSVSKGVPPHRSTSIALGTPDSTYRSIVDVRCKDKVEAVQGGGDVWMLGSDTSHRLNEGQPKPKRQNLSQHVTFLERSLGPDRSWILASWGWGIRTASRFTDWRAVASNLRSAVFMNDLIWAVGEQGLWRFDPAKASLLPIALPRQLAGRALVDIFRDGNVIWVRDSNGTGWPLYVEGARARLVGRSGQLPRLKQDFKVTVGSALLAGKYGESTLKVTMASGDTAALETGIIHTVLPLSDSSFLVGNDRQVMLWTHQNNRYEATGRWTFGSPTVAIFLKAGSLIAVGQTYGFAKGRMSGAGTDTSVP